ncbi:hypothetical protein J6590_096609 [Homalodisca vitripennis]|nr:hypothetical protein J6590_096609 [Homalodisca vitripennis]
MVGGIENVVRSDHSGSDGEPDNDLHKVTAQQTIPRHRRPAVCVPPLWLKREKAHFEVEASHTVCHSQIDQQRREIDLYKQEHELDLRTQTTMKLEIDTSSGVYLYFCYFYFSATVSHSPPDQKKVTIQIVADLDTKRAARIKQQSSSDLNINFFCIEVIVTG